jgi:DNA processing protein
VPRNRLKSHAPDLQPLTAVALVANCIPLVTTAIGVQGRELTLQVRGTLGGGKAVAIVGARGATQVGMRRAHAIAKHLGRHRVRVVSGGALGIDGAAHRGALAGGGTTTVVLGSGIDVLYPQRHAALFAEIVERGGALVSQFPRGMLPRRSTFLQRNHLIAALASAVIVVEADVRSGSLATARSACEQGRLVAAWPGSPGCERLLAAGAAIVECCEDALALANGRPRYPVPPALDATASAIRDAIVSGARGIDAIVRYTGLPVRAVLRALPQLESYSARKQ